MDNSAITSQMAQISQVEGMQTMNTTMQTLLSSQLSSQSMMAATTIGRNALVSGNTLPWSGSGSALEGGVSLAGAANNLTVSVKNAAGQTVDSFNVTSPQSGMNYFAWDGTNGNGTTEPAGNYSFSAQASNSGTAVSATPYSNQTIEAVSWDSSGNPQLQLSGGSTVSMSAVQQIS
jgi:flagellar basal-body rod modification protein FlgD